jgi:hypothetical protein
MKYLLKIKYLVLKIKQILISTFCNFIDKPRDKRKNKNYQTYKAKLLINIFFHFLS